MTDKIPIGLRKPWRWVQPQTTTELINRLIEARDFNVHERERENLCSVAAAKITEMDDELVSLREREKMPKNDGIDSSCGPEASRITELEVYLAAGRSALAEKERELKKLDPDPVVCGCREMLCQHTPIAQLPRQALVDHYRALLKLERGEREAADARAREAAIEDCAKAAGNVPHSTPFASRVITACIVAIRSLKSAPPASPAEQDK